MPDDHQDEAGRSRSWERRSRPRPVHEYEREAGGRRSHVHRVTIHDVSPNVRPSGFPSPPPPPRRQDSGFSASHRMSYSSAPRNNRDLPSGPSYPPPIEPELYPEPYEREHIRRGKRRRSHFHRDGFEDRRVGNRDFPSYRVGPKEYLQPLGADRDRADYYLRPSRHGRSHFRSHGRDRRSESSSSGSYDSTESLETTEMTWRKELERYKRADEEKILTDKVRREAEETMERNLMEKKRQQDEQQQIYNRVRVEAEFNERRRIEMEAKEVKDQEAATIEQMNAMERSIRGKLEAEKWAEEAEKKAKARQIEEIARLSREKMMEAMEDIATLTKEKVLDDIANERQIATAKRGEHDFMMTELLSELRTIIRSDLRQEIRSEVRREIEEEEYEARTGRSSRHYWRYRQGPSTPRYTTPEPRRRSPRPERYREASFGTAYRYPRYREPQDGRYPRAPMVHSSDDESRRHNEEGIASPVSSHFGSYHQPVPEPRLRRRSGQEYRMPSSNESSRGSATDPVVYHMEQPKINLNAADVNQPPERRSASRRKHRESNDRGLVVYIPATSEFEPPPIGSLIETTTAFDTQHDPEIELSSRPNKVEEVEIWNDVETRSLSPTDSSYQTPSEI